MSVTGVRCSQKLSKSWYICDGCSTSAPASPRLPDTRENLAVERRDLDVLLPPLLLGDPLLVAQRNSSGV
jgi:hypothetical protein